MEARPNPVILAAESDEAEVHRFLSDELHKALEMLSQDFDTSS